MSDRKYFSRRIRPNAQQDNIVGSNDVNKIASFNAQAKENNRLSNDNSISDFGQRKMIEALHPRENRIWENFMFLCRR